MKTLSFHAETNGLYGKVFAITAVFLDFESGSKVEWIGRCPIEGEVDPFVSEYVLPQMEREGIPENYEDCESLLKGFAEFYMSKIGTSYSDPDEFLENECWELMHPASLEEEEEEDILSDEEILRQMEEYPSFE